jgi:hypothetical protein
LVIGTLSFVPSRSAACESAKQSAAGRAEVLVRYVHRVKALIALGGAAFVENGIRLPPWIALQTIQIA